MFQIVGCILQIKIMNFILDKIIKLSNKINQIKQFSNINKTSQKFTSSQRADTSAIARKFNFHEGISQSRSFSKKKKPSKIFHSVCLEIYSIFRVAANFLASISSRKRNSPTQPNSMNVSHENV